ncbi:MAG: hypothetical protein JXB13_18400 [Phycisphaerae bacterium]|nr:hypothetical protein [Phycisphaerae bacterium]
MQPGLQSPEAMVRTLRIIVLAMIVGVLALAAVAGAFAPLGAADEAIKSIFVLVVATIGVSFGLGYALVRRQLLARACRQASEGLERDDTQALAMRTYQALVIVGAAMAEGVGSLGAVAVLVTGYWPLAVVPLAAVVLLAMNVPSRDGFAVFAERLAAPPR